MRKKLPKSGGRSWRFRASRFALQISTFALGASLVAAEKPDLSQLPPPAQVKVEFDRDIKPILEKSCLRCHGPERPKSGFRLDNRESALKGGHNGEDIIPGDSAHSAMILNVARLDPDMAMPPEGKGEPLTTDQIALLRAWIDQGAKWGGADESGKPEFTFSPGFRWITVSGNARKFRELEGLKEGWAGGMEHFSFTEKLGPDKRFSAEGHVLFDEHDARLKLRLDKSDVGFVRVGVEQWRSYDDDTGGFYRPFVTQSYRLNRDLRLDHERAWIDLGLTLPRWPQMVLGYEYQSKDGAEATLQWGKVTEPFLDSKNIYPASKEIDEHVHILKFDLTHEILGWRLEDSARVEFYELKTRRDNAAAYTVGPQPDTLERVAESATHVQGANSVRVEKQLRSWWLCSVGYLFSRFDGDASVNQTTLDANLLPASGKFWNTENIVLRRDAHVLSLANLLSPWEGLSATAGVQAEWTRQEGFGNVHLDEGDPNVPGSFALNPATVASDLDRSKTMENFGVRFTKIPYSVFFGEARFEQESIGQFESEIGSAPTAFMRDTEATNDRRDWRAGFNTSPWRWISLNAHYRERWSQSDYDHNLDVFLSPTDGSPLPGDGYSAFITARTLAQDEVQAKLVLRPVNWLKTTLTYRRIATDYSTTTDPVPGNVSPGGSLLAGNHRADQYSLSVAVKPIKRMSLSGTLTYSQTRTETAPDDDLLLTAYDGDTLSVIGSAAYALNATTHLSATYNFSRADFGQSNFDNGLPLGIDYERHGVVIGLSRKFGDRVTANLRYGFYKYSEPSAGGALDYTAHGVFGMMTYTWR